MKSTELFSRLIEKYGFIESVAPVIQKFVEKSSKHILKSSLKSVGNFSYSYGFVISVFYAARRIGIRPSLPAAKITAAVVSALVIAGVAAASVMAAKYFTVSFSTGIVSQANIDNTVMPANRIKTPDIKIGRQSKVKFRIGIKELKSQNIEAVTSKMITDRIAQELSRIMGNEFIVDLRVAGNSKSINNMLTGSVGRFGERIFISVKVVDLSNSRVVVGVNETLASTEIIDSSCETIAQKITDELKKLYNN